MKIFIITLLFLINGNLHSQQNDNKIKDYKIDVPKFLNDKKIPQLAKDLYLGKKKPTDSNENLALIDSLNSSGEFRGFYFLVITRTMEHADGAYSEPLGIATKSYVENNTVEFLSYFNENRDILSNKDFENWAVSIYGEIQIDYEGTEEIAVKNLKTKMVTNCQGLAGDYITKINFFISFMK